MSKPLKLSEARHLLRNSAGHLTFECGEAEPSCEVACSALASSYRVLGTQSLLACSSCGSSDWPAWNGVVEQIGSECRWVLNAIASIGGKTPSFTQALGAYCSSPELPNGVGIWFNETTCLWELVITCRDEGDYRVIWAGTKSVEHSPAGVYTRVCGCDETSTLTVE